MTDTAPSPGQTPAPTDPLSLLKSRSYLALLVLGAVIGVPVATVAYFFLDAVGRVQKEIFSDLPGQLGFHGEPLWWPLPWLALSGLLVALTIRYLPGTSGHEPSKDFRRAARSRRSICSVSSLRPSPPSASAWCSARKRR